MAPVHPKKKKRAFKTTPPKKKLRHLGKRNVPAIKRHLIPKALVPELKAHLEKNLTPASSFFRNLPSTKIGMESYCPIRTFTFKGTKVVIKQTLGMNEHGNTPKWILQDLFAHHKLARAGKIDTSKYALFTPKIYFQIGSYIVMEHIENVERDFRTNPARSPQLIEARKQLKENLVIVSKNSEMGRPIQTHHFMVTGTSRGKIVFFSPYDYEAR